MTKENILVTYENNVFYCTKNGTKWISVDGEKWYGEEKRIAELEKENEMLKGDLELWESGGCRATNLFECGVVKELKEQIEKLKTDIDNAIAGASKWYVTDPVYSMLVDIYNDNFELKEIEK